MKIVALLGNPNCGKTTIFNALTGSCQRVGNWPGVTVDRKSGCYNFQQEDYEVVDLPGTYSLTSVSEGALDEQICCEYIFSDHPDLVVNIIDASNLERNLYLTMQLLEMRVPMIVAVNMLDVAKKQHCQLNLKQLSRLLDCPVVALEAHKNKGVTALKTQIAQAIHLQQVPTAKVRYPEAVNKAVKTLTHTLVQQQSELSEHAHCLAVRLLEDDVYAMRQLQSHDVKLAVSGAQLSIRQALDEDPDILLADARYGCSHEIVRQVLKRAARRRHVFTEYVDKVVLNRYLGIPVFLLIMYLMFFFAINVGGALQDFFDLSSEALFVTGLSQLLTSWHMPVWLTALLASGVGKGINTTVAFVPVIGAMFLFLAVLERSGYMARAAFVMDRLMRALGLPGKSFVPMIVGFGCNVPAIMAARTLENRRDRILTVMMSPFMSCGARLAIYAVFTAAFFPVGGQNVVFALYMIGIVMAVVTGLILRNTLLQGEASPLVMELPPYHVPSFIAVQRQAWFRLKQFLMKAGRVIIPVCIIVGALNSVTIHGALSTDEANSQSLLSVVGRTATPIFSPMGIKQDNWPATVGLLSGVLAKEVVVGTLNTLYSQVGGLAEAPAEDVSVFDGLQDAVRSVPDNFIALGHAIVNPVSASAPDQDVTQGVYGVMFQYFDGRIGAFAYLLFVLLYFPCVSATAAMWRELTPGWAVFSVAWTTGLAYAVAVVFYQVATWLRHPLSSTVWIGLMLSVFIAVVLGMKRHAGKDDQGGPGKLSLAGGLVS